MKVLAAIAVALCLSGCASPRDPWVKVRPAVEVTSITEVAMPCGLLRADGCFRHLTGAIELRAGMSDGKRWCVEQHERKHAAGYDNLDEGRAIATDCGNGEIYSAPPEMSPFARFR